jgi:hypothetical protein
MLLLEYPGDGAPGFYLNSGIVPNGRRLLAPADGRSALRATVASDQDSRHREIFYAGLGWDLTS